jgi:hypothetical protein
MKTLTKKQKFVLEEVKKGGSLLEEVLSGKLYFSDSEGNCHIIHQATLEKLCRLDLLQIGHPPALDLIRYIV